MKKELKLLSSQIEDLSKNYEYLQQIQAMIINGFGVCEFFKEHHVKKVYLYFDEMDWGLAEPICLDFDNNYHADIISICISEEGFQETYGMMNFFGIVRNHSLGSIDISPQDTILIIKPTFEHELNNKLKRLGKCIWLSDLLIQMRSYFLFLRPLNELRNRVSNLSVVTFNGPLFPTTSHRELTEAEKKIAEDNILLKDIVNTLKTNNEIITPAFDEFSYSSPEQLLEVLSPPISYFDNSGLLKIQDTHNAYMNVTNGVRHTLEVPKDAKSKVFIVGNCVEFGHGASDSGTIQSHLQRRLNEAGYKYEVVNLGTYLTSRWKGYSKIIKNIPANPGDIIFLRTFISEEELSVKGELFCNLADLFSQPHSYGEVVYDCSAHLTENGNKAVADEFFQYMLNKKLFEIEYDNHSVQKTKLLQLEQSKFEELNNYLEELTPLQTKIGSIVMNCNPFTLGHRYLIEESAKKVSSLYIFVVEEDKSYFPFADRIDLVKQGVKDIDNVIVIPSGKFIISSLTFTDYFGKSELQEKEIDPSMDIELFAKYIAPKLNINVRFAGEEPLDNITQQYNIAMNKILPQYGIDFEVISRKESGNSVISASRVRRLLKEKDFDAIAKIVPKTTFNYLQNKFSDM